MPKVHKSSVTPISTLTGATQKMKSVIHYPYGPFTGNGYCRMFHARNLALASSIYTINISLIIIFLYSWRISINIRKIDSLEDVYYGVQIAYSAIIGTQFLIIFLSICLLLGIFRENTSLIVPWIIGFITFMALEAVAVVYSNVLRDHVNKHFDVLCKAEVTFFLTRALLNVLAIWAVLRFYNNLRSGITWREPAAKTSITRSRLTPAQRTHLRRKRREKLAALRTKHSKTSCCLFGFDYDDDYDYDADYDDIYDIMDDYDEEDDYDLDLDLESFSDDDDDEYDIEADGNRSTSKSSDDSDCAMLGESGNKTSTQKLQRQGRDIQRRSVLNPAIQIRHGSGSNYNNNIRSVLVNKRYNKYRLSQPPTKLEVINESDRSAGSGSDDHDNLLVAYDSASSLASV